MKRFLQDKEKVRIASCPETPLLEIPKTAEPLLPSPAVPGGEPAGHRHCQQAPT